jgi:hypothetical protein
MRTLTQPGGGGDFPLESDFILSVHASVLPGYYNVSCSGQNNRMSHLSFQGKCYETRCCLEQPHSLRMAKLIEREGRLKLNTKF